SRPRPSELTGALSLLPHRAKAAVALQLTHPARTGIRLRSVTTNLPHMLSSDSCFAVERASIARVDMTAAEHRSAWPARDEMPRQVEPVRAGRQNTSRLGAVGRCRQLSDRSNRNIG